MRLISVNAFHHSIQNLLSFCLVSKNLNIRIYNTIMGVKLGLRH
jgi:hypothetical protein